MLDEVCNTSDSSELRQKECQEKVEHLERLSMALIQADFSFVEAEIED
tara:strand:- start:408 stop:551 length:144 start_codon:yes stop_codon:yes gene_type:complete